MTKDYCEGERRLAKKAAIDINHMIRIRMTDAQVAELKAEGGDTRWICRMTELVCDSLGVLSESDPDYEKRLLARTTYLRLGHALLRYWLDGVCQFEASNVVEHFKNFPVR